MSESFDDDWDPFWHTEEENAAHAEERLQRLEAQYENDPVFRFEVDHVDLNADLDDHLDDLERLIRDDALGFYWFADRPNWINARLPNPNTPK